MNLSDKDSDLSGLRFLKISGGFFEAEPCQIGCDSLLVLDLPGSCVQISHKTLKGMGGWPSGMRDVAEG